MRIKLSIFIWVLGLLLFVVSCAKKGSISGGLKDETPPVFIKAIPPNYSTNFDKKEVRIYFDEYIKLEDAQKQIIISPPMDPKPSITPVGTASKYIKIEFLDTLLENTTYSINFGSSVVDNNEGNPFPFFKYVFSTGDFLDSLSIQGTISDALVRKADPFVTIALYEVNENYTDSLPFKEVPRYIANTLDSTVFVIDNIKEGKYKLIAFKDASTNYTYEPKQDKIGFYDTIVDLPADTSKVFNLNLFKEQLDFKALRPKQVSKYHFIFGYEGKSDSTQIKLISDRPDNYTYRILKDREKDTLHYWYKPFFEADSLLFEISQDTNRDTLVARYKDQFKDSLVLTSLVRSALPFDKNYTLTANTPLDSVKKELITIIDKDSTNIAFKTEIDTVSNELSFLFERTENNAYNVEILPEAITDFIGNKNDSLTYNFRTTKLADYGKIFLTLENAKQYPIIVQLLTEKEELVKEKIVSEQKTIIFENLDPAKYLIRVIYDQNNNGVWDTGNFLKSIQPEKVIYFPEVIDVRANWELKQTFVLE